MSKYYKTANTVMAVDDVTEWKGERLVSLIVASTSSHTPFSICAHTPAFIAKEFEPATMSEWYSMLEAAEKRQAELDKAAAEKEEGEKYGIKVERYRFNFHSRKDITHDTIVRCTKTRWVGLQGSYKRNTRHGMGHWVGGDGFGDTITLHVASLETLAKRADGRLVVDFVKGAKKAEQAAK